MTSSTKLAVMPMTPPPPRRSRRDGKARTRPDHLRNQQHDHAEPEQRHHQLDVEPRPGRKQLEIVVEIFRPDQVRLHGEREADAEHQQPQRRGQVAHDADAEMHAAGEAQARGADDFHVLQVALSPAAVANGDVDERRAGILPRNRRSRSPCAPSSRRGASAPPRRNHATARGRRRACGPRARAGRSTRRTPATRMMALWPQ